MMRVRAIHLLLPLMAVAAFAACGGDAPEPEEQGSAGFVLEGEEPYVSPEDSLQAEADVQEHAESVHERAQREAGVKGDDRPPAAPAATGSAPGERYRACLAQANQAEGEVRGRLLAACENVRRQPPPEAP
ncbi:MAG TPA: hypothetical protein VF142_21860 [Longimicrobium sp.]